MSCSACLVLPSDTRDMFWLSRADLNCQFAGIGLVYLADVLTDKDGGTGKVNIGMSVIQIGMMLLQMVFFRGEMRRAAAHAQQQHGKANGAPGGRH
jgi:hypothetical protein